MISLDSLQNAINVIPTGLFILPLIIVGIFLIFEKIAPYKKLPRKQLNQSYKTNLGIFVFNMIVMSLLSTTTVLMLIDIPATWGIVNYIPIPITKVLISFLLIDFFLYTWHRISHQVDFLWMFHKVHHNDPYMNVTTGFRIHIGELFLLTAVKTMFILLIGIDQVAVFINEVITAMFIAFHHSNIRFKEKWISKVFITPALHYTHHSVERNEHDTNYGAVFSIWDRILNSLLETRTKQIGIKGYSPQSFWNLLKFGFMIPTMVLSKKPYYSVSIHEMIAIAAYYKAEKRGFTSNQELTDWLIAEKEIQAMVNIPVPSIPIYSFKWLFPFFNKKQLMVAA